MVDNILKAIDEKAEEQIVEILQKKEIALLAMQEDNNIAIQTKQKEQKDLGIRKVAKEIEDFEKTLQMSLNFSLQGEKNNLIKEVYNKAQEKVSLFGEVELKKLIKHWMSYLPEAKKGHITAGERTAKILKDFVDSEMKLDGSLEEEGFIFVSNDVEIDCRISQAFSQLQETVNPELIKMLFS
ncbi:MAG: hypothetical protein V1819_02480 [bacterium]